ncbi:MAG: CHASE2 domain-containing protein [Panacagrimonas sp.]
MRGIGSQSLAAAAFVALALLDILVLHGMQPLGNRLTDALQKIAARAAAPDPEVVIVDIDETSLARLEEKAGSWPWPRAIHAELLEGLAEQKPAAIVFDVLFAEADSFRPESDAALIEAIENTPNAYVPMVRLDERDDATGVPLAEVAEVLGLERTDAAQPGARASLLPPGALPPELWRTGAINYLEDPDGVGRRYYLYLDLYGWRLPSLPAVVARDLGWSVPDQESLRLAYRSGKPGFRRVSYAELYEDFQRETPQRAADEFRDAVVVIGTAASGLGDLRTTPIASLTPGVEILATAIENLKNGRGLQELSPLVPAGLAVVLIAGVAIAFALGVNVYVTGLVLAIVIGLLVAASGLLMQRLVVLPVFEPLAFAAAFYVFAALMAWRREREARRHAVQLFGRFLDPEVVRRLVDRGETIESLSGRTCQLSVLFSDIRGFTSLSETRPPQEIVELLNRYFSRQVAVVFRHGGTLDKFIGDCIMAFWGAPIDDPRHARRAVDCALDMSRELDEFRKELGEAGRDFDVGIGIHSGSAVVGFIGAQQKLDYTAIGDTVNLASRIEGLTKNVARILVSRDTMDACGHDLQFTARGAFPVKGRAQAVHLYEPRPPS